MTSREGYVPEIAGLYMRSIQPLSCIRTSSRGIVHREDRLHALEIPILRDPGVENVSDEVECVSTQDFPRQEPLSAAVLAGFSSERHATTYMKDRIPVRFHVVQSDLPVGKLCLELVKTHNIQILQ